MPPIMGAARRFITSAPVPVAHIARIRSREVILLGKEH
jgi:hypothetical protein